MRRRRTAALTAMVQAMAAEHELEPEQVEAIHQAAKKLDHALAVKDVRGIERAVDDIARRLLKRSWK